jgi:hypothetical protein
MHIEQAIEIYIAKLTTCMATHYAQYGPTIPPPTIVIMPRQKYLKIVELDNSGSSNARRVHSFIDKKTGDLYKAASWNAPPRGLDLT